jgi:hypothetical protein
VRPDLVPGEPLWFADDSSGTRRRLNPDAFAFPAGDVSGSLGRNSLRSSLLKQLDLAVSRTIQLTTRASLQVRVEAFNVLNIPNFGPPEAFFGASAFGQSVRSYADALGTGTLMFGGLAPIYQAGGPRSIQLALRGRF